MVTRFSATVVAASLTMLVAGCGGSGSDPTDVPGHLANVTTEQKAGLATALNSAGDQDRLMPRQIDPELNSVVQSSSDEGEVSVTVDYDKGLKYTVTSVNPNWEITPDNADNSRDMPVYPQGKELTKKVAGGTVYVDVYTDYDKSVDGGDTDYLAGGVWLFVPEDSSGTYSLGAFVSGNSPTPSSVLVSGLGKAKYSGNARGEYLTESGKIGYLDGSVSLNADFEGTGENREGISGEITNIRMDDTSAKSGSKLVLEHTGFGGDASAQFEGDVSGTVNDIDYTGDWGGRFFGTYEYDNKTPNDDADDATYPRTVGGTFTAIPTEDDDDVDEPSFLGMIRTYISPSSITP